MTAVAQVPLYGRLARVPVTAEGRTTLLSHNYVDHRYFDTLALPVEGRSFTVAETSARAKVAIISQATRESSGPRGRRSAKHSLLTPTPMVRRPQVSIRWSVSCRMS